MPISPRDRPREDKAGAYLPCGSHPALGRATCGHMGPGCQSWGGLADPHSLPAPGGLEPGTLPHTCLPLPGRWHMATLPGPSGADEDLAQLCGSQRAPPPWVMPLEMGMRSPASFWALPCLGTPAAASAGGQGRDRGPGCQLHNEPTGPASEPSGRQELGPAVRGQHTPQPPSQPSLGSESDNLLVTGEGAASGTAFWKPGAQPMA